MYENFVAELERAMGDASVLNYRLLPEPYLDECQYERGKCHHNAAIYVGRHAGATVVQCWIKIQDNWWAKHSIVKTAQGEHLDVTLREKFPYTAVRHDAVAEFCDLPFDKMPVEVKHFGHLEAF